MFDQEFMRNALLAGTFIALACGVCGWFVILRAQVFAGDALGHVAFPGALAAAAIGIDERVGLFLATVLVALLIGALGRGALARRGTLGAGSLPADDTAIGIVFTFVLGLGVLMTALASRTSPAGITAARTLFGSIFGLGAGEARLAAVIGIAVVLVLVAIARPLLFASLAPDVAGARGVPTRALGLGFLVLLGVVAAEGTQAVGALLMLGLLASPAAAAHRLTPSPGAGVALAGALAVAAMWGGLVLAYAVPSLPPSSAIVAIAVLIQLAAAVAT